MQPGYLRVQKPPQTDCCTHLPETTKKSQGSGDTCVALLNDEFMVAIVIASAKQVRSGASVVSSQRTWSGLDSRLQAILNKEKES